MEPKISNSTLSILFWLKVTFAVIYAVGGLGYLCYLTTSFYKVAIDKQSERAINVTITAEKCGFVDRGKARLEPPDSRRYFGFHLAWDKQIPNDVNTKLGFYPTV